MTEYIVDLAAHNAGAAMALCAVVHEEIVRCRDCKWFTPEYEYLEEREYGVFETFVEPSDCGNPERCSHHHSSVLRKTVPVHIETQPDGYCAWGERRSDGQL